MSDAAPCYNYLGLDMLELTERQKHTLQAVADGSREPLHNHSLTVLLNNELIKFTQTGNGWGITEKGRQKL